jgi:translation elongation factor EF-1alpha
MSEIRIGRVKHFFARPMVAVVEVQSASLKVGDAVHIKGLTTDLHHRIDSIQIEHSPVQSAAAGDVAGIKVSEKVRVRDEVFRVREEETG